MKTLVILSAQKTLEHKDGAEYQAQVDEIVEWLEDKGWVASVDYDEEV